MRASQAHPKLKTFIYESNKVRSFLDLNGDPWFIANDISSFLGYRMISDATRLLDKEEKGILLILQKRVKFCNSYEEAIEYFFYVREENLNLDRINLGHTPNFPDKQIISFCCA